MADATARLVRIARRGVGPRLLLRPPDPRAPVSGAASAGPCQRGRVSAPPSAGPCQRPRQALMNTQYSLYSPPVLVA
jgi:hypothetical protein